MTGKMKERSYTGSKNTKVSERELLNREVARKAAVEGIVLLKNDDNILPVCVKERIALYGSGAVHTVKGGTGSGDVNERESVSIYAGLKNAGYTIVNEERVTEYAGMFDEARKTWRDGILARVSPGNDGEFFRIYNNTPFVKPAEQKLVPEIVAQENAKTAVYVLSRIAGEGSDRSNKEGDYLLLLEEQEILSDICSLYENVIVVINTGGIVDLGFVDQFSNIKGVIYLSQAGMEGGNAFADVMSGNMTPSGKLTDSWPYAYNDFPNAETFSHINGNTTTERYEEGIYVGYRYFDTFQIPVRYTFGYGLSYTDFCWKLQDCEVIRGNGIPELMLRIKVKNEGTEYAGKEVIQVYISCPQESREKEFRRLVGFAKTNNLQPGESQELEIKYSVDQLTSYDETVPGWVLDEGQYGIWIGNALGSSGLSASFTIESKTIVEKTCNVCVLQEELNEMRAPVKNLLERERQWKEEAQELPHLLLDVSDICTRDITYEEVDTDRSDLVRELTGTLSREQLVQMVIGDIGKGQGSQIGAAGHTVPGAAGETSSCAKEAEWNIASIVLADGPAGLRLMKKYAVNDGKIKQKGIMAAMDGGFFDVESDEGELYYQYCTAIPVGTLLAQTWNVELIKEIGKVIAVEMEEFQVTLWLAPGMNIHRNPLCGRNFEYYSEDPFVSGCIASAMTLGVQSVPGCGTTIKHFAGNNQEDNRMKSDSVIGERALREIYLKGFEIAVKQSQPMSIMTSYNLINGVHTANSIDLCTKIARGEWGFQGMIMTDWLTTNPEMSANCTAAGCIRAGNDLIMPGGVWDMENLEEELNAGSLSIEQLKKCVYRLVKIILQSNQYEDAASYLNQFSL